VHSGGFRGFTVVTVVTIMVAPVFRGHHWLWEIIGRSEKTEIRQCVVHQPCPRHERIVEVVTVQAPTPPAPAPDPKPKKH
jgi:hypothetical protein